MEGPAVFSPVDQLGLGTVQQYPNIEESWQASNGLRVLGLHGATICRVFVAS